MEITVEGSSRRCPYCHDSVDEATDRAACQECLAVHHIACWDELGKCGGCGHDRALMPEAVEPDVVLERSTVPHTPPTSPSPLGGRLKTLLLLTLCAAYGFAAIGCGFLFFRMGVGEQVLFPIVLGLGGLLLAAGKRKLIAVGVGSVCGLLLASKPWVHPLIGEEGRVFNPTSETGLYFVVPGVLLLVLTGLIALSIRRTEIRLEPLPVLPVLFCLLGAAGAGAYYSQPTRAEVLERQRPRTEELLSVLREAADRPRGRLEGRDLSPEPRYARYGPSNVSFVPVEVLEDPNAKTHHYYPGSWALLDLLRHVQRDPAAHSRMHLVASARYAKRYQEVTERPYVALYRKGAKEIEVYLVDTRSGKIVAQGVTPCAEPTSILEGPRAVLGLLTELTGGSFERT